MGLGLTGPGQVYVELRTADSLSCECGALRLVYAVLIDPCADSRGDSQPSWGERRAHDPVVARCVAFLHKFDVSD